jgi:hypothetical protein
MRNESRIKIRSLPVLLAVALLSIGIAACGGASKSTGSSQASSNPAVTGGRRATTASTTTAGRDSADGDKDTEGNDDNPILAFGHAANEADERAITALVKRYYAAAAADNGAAACSLIFVIFQEAIPEDYGQLAGPRALRGKTCAVVMSKLFKLERRQIVVHNSTLKVTSVRVDGKKGYALLRFGTMPEPRFLQVHIEFGVWKVDSLIDGALP